MCSSGLSDVTAPIALSVGAKGVGIGSMVNKLEHPQQMLMAVTAIAEAMGISPDDFRRAEEFEFAPSTVSAIRSENVKL